MAMTIAVTAPARALEREAAKAVEALSQELFGARAPEMRFHPQCFERAGHFAGSDEARVAAFVEVANDPAVDAVWFARGGYGSCRLDAAFEALGPAARDKVYLGYSDTGFLLGRLQNLGVGRPAHGPMPADILRDRGTEAVARSLKWLVDGDAAGLAVLPQPDAPTLAYNVTVLAHAMSGAWRPSLAGRVLIVEEIDEYLYRIDRALGAVFAHPEAGELAGVMLGRCSGIPENDIEFGQTPEEILRYWAGRVGVPYLGRADIGHDVDNKIVPFG
ncbi:MAG: LD-carboxypeptidase [Pseudomonadota bacterium]